MNLAIIIAQLLREMNLSELFKGKEVKFQEFVLALTEKVNVLNAKQIELNMVEAKHKSIFVSGWRAFIGWAGGFGIAYNYIIQPFLVGIVNIWLPDYELPYLDLTQLMTLILAMLGMSTVNAIETYKIEKLKR